MMNNYIPLRHAIITIVLFITSANAYPQQPNTFSLFNEKGKSVSYQAMIKMLSDCDVVFVGEYHNCPISHWMELKVLKSLHSIHKGKLKVGMEMFERDIQYVIDEYFNGEISYKFFESDTRPWPNYDTDYSPVVDYAKENGLRLIATNVARRYAALVSKKGLQSLDSLQDVSKKSLPPLPIYYKSNEESNNMFSIMGGMMGKNTDSEFMSQAQALKDATMAYSIQENMPSKFIHFNGTIHSDNKDGIIKYLLRYNPSIKIGTITTVKQEDIDKLESDYHDIADFIIVVPDDFPTSY